MKVVILAAGKGSRLGNSRLPKPLTPLITGKSILEHQLENLSLYVPLHQVLIVVGYRKEEIMQRFNLDSAVEDAKSRFKEPQYVYSPLFAEENTSKSLLLALKRCNEDVLWLNGDVVFHSSVLKKVLETPRTSMVVNVGHVGEEEVKYRQNAQGRILEVSKHVKAPQGEALGINYIAQKDLPDLISALEICSPQDYFERAIETCIENGMAVWTVPVDAALCTEIDFPEDLERANDMIQSWT